MAVPKPSDELSLTAPLANLAWIDRFFSIPLIFFLLGAATFFIAWNRGIALMYALFAMLIGGALFSFLAARMMVRPAKVQLSFPTGASVGESILVRISVTPESWPRKRRMVQLGSPYPFAPGQDAFLSECSAGLSREQRVICTRRGIYRLTQVETSCAYPLGLTSAKKRWAVEPVGITIHPRIYPGQGLIMRSESERSDIDMERPASARGHELFREVREYRRGDNPRHIHWRSSARRGELVVRQFDALSTSETWIVLDLNPAGHAGQGADHSFERSLEIGASIAVQQCHAGLRCGIAGGTGKDGMPLIFLAPNTGTAHLHAILDALAVVGADCAEHYGEVLEKLAPYHRSGQQWILFGHGEGHVAAPAFLRGQRAPFWFRFDTASFDTVEPRGPDLQAPVRQSDGYAIARDSDLSLIFRS
ncbi:hypothetical protein BH11PSE11_BH11PSE11_27670 [soil metagenome]